MGGGRSASPPVHSCGCSVTVVVLLLLLLLVLLVLVLLLLFLVVVVISEWGICFWTRLPYFWVGNLFLDASSLFLGVTSCSFGRANVHFLCISSRDVVYFCT